MSLADDQHAFARMCLDPAPDARDCEQLRAPTARLMVYRNMVRGRLVELIGDAMPRTRDAVMPADLNAMMGAFLATRPHFTRYIREVTPRFVAWLGANREVIPASVAPWWLDLARYESAVLAMNIANDPTGDGVVDFDMALPVALTTAQRLLRVGWTVHETEIRPVDAKNGLALLVYRDPQKLSIETFVLSPIAGDIYEAWGENPTRSATENVQGVLARHHASAGQVFIESFAELVGDFLDRGVILGSRG